MATITLGKSKRSNSKKINDDFEVYLNKQRLQTTFNGIEVSSFSWYKKKIGLSS